MIKAVIFDLNGVFLESEWLSVRMEKAFGVVQDKFIPALKEIMTVVRKPDAPAAFSLWKPYLSEWGVDLTEKEFFDFWFSGEHLVPDLLDFAKEIRGRGLKVYVLSNNFRERTEYYRQHFPELFADLDGAFFSWETSFVKPDPKAYENILKQMNLEADECIYTDDSEKNIEVARGMGFKCVLYKGRMELEEIINRELFG